MKYKRVTVYWIDSITHMGWEPVEKYKDTKPESCETTGYLIADREDFITLALSLSDVDVNGTVVIPRQCVSRMEELESKMPQLPD